MNNKAKKIILLFMLLVIPFMATGCGKNNSAKDVAVEMVTRLSKDNYKNMGDIFYQVDSYFDEEAFKEIIEEKKLNISGNKTIEVKEVGNEITDSTTGNSTVKVKIEIDGDRTFNVDTIKVDDKWYVYEPEFYNGNVEIVVPSGATVKFNDKKLDKSYLSTKKIDTKATYPNSYSSVKLEDVEMDVYTVKNVLSGKYAVSIKGTDTNEIKDVVYTYSESGTKSNNYEVNTTYSTKTKTYTFKLPSNDSDIETYVKKYLNDIYSIADTTTFDSVSKYFDADSTQYNTYKTNFESLVKKSKKDNGLSYYYSDFKVSNTEFKNTYVYDENHIVVMVGYDLSYKRNYSSSTYDKSSAMKSILVLKKDSKGNYVITNGYNVFIRL